MDPDSLKYSLPEFFVSIGFTFGFDFGITGGLLLNPTFLEKFFPNAYIKNTIPNSLALVGDFDVNLYRSCLYLAAFISAYKINIFRIHTYAKMRIGGCFTFIGATIGIGSALAENIILMTCGRIFLGIGFGILIQVVVTHASETRYRRQVVTLFPRAISCGIVIGNGWFNCVVRALAVTAGDLAYANSFFFWMVVLFPLCNIPFTSERIKRLFNDSSKDIENCVKTEGPAATDEAERSLIQPVETSPNSAIFRRKYIPSLVVAICISIFQQFTGVYALMIYAPVLFKAVGLNEGISIFCSIVMYFANCYVTCDPSVVTTRKFGRRSLFIQGGTIMLLCQIIITFITRVHDNLGVMPGWNALLLVVAMIAYGGGFAWSWGPLGWLVPSEILPLEIQSIGYTLCVSMNMLSMFFVSQFFTMGLSEMRFGMHLVILSLVFFMTIFVYVLLPETKGVKVKDASEIWKTHWFWKKFMEE